MQPSYGKGMPRMPVVGALFLLSTICVGFFGQGVLAGRSSLTTAQPLATLVHQIYEEHPLFPQGAETVAHRRRLSSEAREYQAFGQECSGDDTDDLRSIDCPIEGCQEACSDACDADELCEAFETKSNIKCVLYRRCELVEMNNLPRSADGNLSEDYVRLRAWNITARRSTANVCVRGCPDSSLDYVVTRDYLRLCTQESVIGTRDLSEACGPGDQECAISACANFCRPETSCAEFSVTTDLLTCELQDGSCTKSTDLFANKFQVSFRGETAEKKQKEREEMEAQKRKEEELMASLLGGPNGADGKSDGDSSEDSSAAYPGGNSPSQEDEVSESRSSRTGGRRYTEAGKKCIGSPTRELYNAKCAPGSTKQSCNRACADLCDGEEACEAYMFNSRGVCALYRRCAVVEAVSVSESAVHVCIDGCPATSDDYYVTRQLSSSCGLKGTIAARDMRICDGNRLCAIRKCANFCRTDSRCREFVLTDDLETCKLSDGSCQTVDDTGIEFVGRLGRSQGFGNDDDSDGSSSGGRTGIRGSSTGLDLFNNRDSSGFDESEEIDDGTASAVNPGGGREGVTVPETAPVQEVDEEQIEGDAEDEVGEIEDEEEENADEVIEDGEETQEELQEQRDLEVDEINEQLDSRAPPAINATTFRQEVQARRPAVRASSRT